MRRHRTWRECTTPKKRQIRVPEQLEALATGRLVSASRDSSVMIWNVETLKAEAVLPHDNQVWSLEVSQDPWEASCMVELPHGRLAVAVGDAAIEIWKLLILKLRHFARRRRARRI